MWHLTPQTDWTCFKLSGVTHMLAFLRANGKIFFLAALFITVIGGGIYYVDFALKAQVQVIE